MSGLVKSTFIQPYPQAHLGGRLGLTSADLAAVLGVRQVHVIQRLEHRGYAQKLKDVKCSIKLVFNTNASIRNGRKKTAAKESSKT